MLTFLIAETDSTCKRNAFVFLAHCSMPKAVEYILSIYDTIPALDEALQMAIVEVIRLDCKNDSAHRARYIRCIFELLNVTSHTVKYEAATTLTTLTQNPAAIKGSFTSAPTSCILSQSFQRLPLVSSTLSLKSLITTSNSLFSTD